MVAGIAANIPKKVEAEVIDFKAHVKHSQGADDQADLTEQMEQNGGSPFALMIAVAAQYMDGTEKNSMDTALDGVLLQTEQYQNLLGAASNPAPGTVTALQQELNGIVNGANPTTDQGNLAKYNEELVVQNQLVAARNELAVKQNQINLAWNQEVNPIQTMIEQEGNICGYLIKTNIICERQN